MQDNKQLYLNKRLDHLDYDLIYKYKNINLLLLYNIKLLHYTSYQQKICFLLLFLLRPLLAWFQKLKSYFNAK